MKVNSTPSETEETETDCDPAPIPDTVTDPMPETTEQEPDAVQTAPAAQTDSRTQLETRIRAEAAEITQIAAQAARLGVSLDAAEALRAGKKPDALRRAILEQAAAQADARDVVASSQASQTSPAAESPIVAAAKRAAQTAQH